MLFTIYLLAIFFYFYRTNKAEIFYLLILLLPSLPIFIQLITDYQLITFNQDIQTKKTLDKSLIIFSVFLIFFKLGLLTTNNKKLKFLNNIIIIKSQFVNLIFLLLFLYLLALQRPNNTIYTGFRYGVDLLEKSFNLNTIPIMLFTSLLIYLVRLLKKNNNIFEYTVFTLIYFIGVVHFNLLIGMRVEPLGLTFAIYFLFINYLSKKQILGFNLIFVGFILYVLSIGIIRSGGEFSYDKIFYSLITFADIANSYLVTIDMIDNNINYNFMWFEFLWNNILSTPPNFFDLYERPISPATLISVSEYTSSGGIYWFGSIYWSFGFGGIVYLYFFGLFLGVLNNYRDKIGTIGNYLFLISIMLSFRLIYYGGLSLYKGFIVLFLLLAIMKTLELLLKSTKPSIDLIKEKNYD